MPRQFVAAEALEPYRIHSYVLTSDLMLKNVTAANSLAHRGHLCDKAPLVRAAQIPLAIRQSRISIPKKELARMNEVELQPHGTHQLRGASLAITANMTKGWVSATSRTKRTDASKICSRRSFDISQHCDMESRNLASWKLPDDIAPRSTGDEGDILQMVYRPLHTLTGDDLAGKSVRNPHRYVDSLEHVPGAWGVKHSAHYEQFSEKTKELLSRDRDAHKPVLHSVAVL